MTPASEAIAMSHSLSPPRQNHILSQCEWTPEGRVRLLCTHANAHLIRYAGVTQPRVMETYIIPVKRDRCGFLVVDLFPADDSPPASPLEDFEHFLAEFRAARLFELTVAGRVIRISATAYDSGVPARATDHELIEAAFQFCTTDKLAQCEIAAAPEPARNHAAA